MIDFDSILFNFLLHFETLYYHSHSLHFNNYRRYTFFNIDENSFYWESQCQRANSFYYWELMLTQFFFNNDETVTIGKVRVGVKTVSIIVN